MDRKRVRFLIGAAALLGGASLLFQFVLESSRDLPLLDIRSSTIETAPLCPWREPQTDLAALFPGATRHKTENRVLSHRLLELAQRLGRMPTPEEISIHLYRIYAQQELLGTVMTRRVKGEFGAIEIVLGINTNGAVTGLRLQRLREPDAIAAVLSDASLLAAFRGKTADSQWQLGQGLPDVSLSARVSVEAIAEGVRSLLVLLDTAEKRKIHAAHKHPLTNEKLR